MYRIQCEGSIFGAPLSLPPHSLQQSSETIFEVKFFNFIKKKTSSAGD